MFPELVVGWNRNQWPDAAGIGGRIRPEYTKLSNEAVKALDSNVFGPEKAEDGHWACFYVKEGVLGQAISPPDEPTLKQYISRHKK